MTTTTAAPSRGTRYLRDLLLGILPILFAIQLLGWLTFFPSALRGHADFRQLYAAGYMVRTGHGSELYDYRAQENLQGTLVGNDERALPFIRPAYQALLFVPFSRLPYRAAFLAFLAVNVILLGLVFLLLGQRMKNLSEVWRGLPVSLFLVFYPVALALMQGQDSILLLALLAAALVALERGHEFTGGFLVALGLFKLQIVIPIALLFLLWRRWRFLAGFALSALLLSAVSLAVVGLSPTGAFVRSLLSVGGVTAGNPSSFPLRVSIMANLRGLISGLASTMLSGIWVQILTVALSVAVLLAVAMLAPGRRRSTDGFIIAITASVIVSYYLFIHDLSVLLIPIVITLDRFIHAEARDKLGRAAAWTSALLLVAPMCIFVMPSHFYLVALPLCAFMVILTGILRREDCALAGTVTFSRELNG